MPPSYIIILNPRQARAVLIVGIPYPSYKDLKVKLKRAFEDDRGTQAAAAAAQRRAAVAAASSAGSSSSTALVLSARAARSKLAPSRSRTRSGAVWYEQQAYRALNQAVGRCIRHKFDFGAIVFLDDRFESDSSVRGLSKWLRKSVKRVAVHHLQCAEALTEFFAHQGEATRNVPRQGEAARNIPRQRPPSPLNFARLEAETVCRSAPSGIERIFPLWRRDVAEVLAQCDAEKLANALAGLRSHERSIPVVSDRALRFFELLVERQLERVRGDGGGGGGDTLAEGAAGAEGMRLGGREATVAGSGFTEAFLALQAVHDRDGVDSSWGARVAEVPSAAAALSAATAPVIPAGHPEERPQAPVAVALASLVGDGGFTALVDNVGWMGDPRAAEELAWSSAGCGVVQCDLEATSTGATATATAKKSEAVLKKKKKKKKKTTERVKSTGAAAAAGAAAKPRKRPARSSDAESELRPKKVAVNSKRKKQRRGSKRSAVAAPPPATPTPLAAAPGGYDSADDFESPAW